MDTAADLKKDDGLGCKELIALFSEDNRGRGISDGPAAELEFGMIRAPVCPEGEPGWSPTPCEADPWQAVILLLHHTYLRLWLSFSSLMSMKVARLLSHMLLRQNLKTLDTKQKWQVDQMTVALNFAELRSKIIPETFNCVKVCCS